MYPLDEYISFDEMANIYKTSSGLPVNIWVDMGGLYKKGGHGKRIKFQNDYGNKCNENNTLSMTIEDDPRVILKQSSRLKIESSDVELIKKFVIINKVALSDVADQKIDSIQFAKLMKMI